MLRLQKKIEKVSEAFDAFKANLNHIQSLSDFTSTFDSFRENLEKVENVSSEVNNIKDEIKSLIKQEDLDELLSWCVDGKYEKVLYKAIRYTEDDEQKNLSNTKTMTRWARTACRSISSGTRSIGLSLTIC